MKEFLEPRLEILPFVINDEMLLTASSIEGEGDGSDGVQTPIIPFT